MNAIFTSLMIFSLAVLVTTHAEAQAEKHCFDTSGLQNYTILSDQKIHLHHKEGDKLMLLAGICPQLKFQGYFTFVPIDGQLCAKRDVILSRTGDICTIAEIIPSINTEEKSNNTEKAPQP